MRTFLSTASLLFLLACGGPGDKSQTSVKPETTDTDPGDKPVEETPEEKLARQQADAVDKMCQRTVDCMVEDARAQLPPDEAEKLEDPQILGRAHAECEDNYGKTSMSPRQVVGIRECLGQPSECPAFGECVYRALRPADSAETETSE